MRCFRGVVACAAAVGLGLSGASVAQAFDPAYEASNYAKTQERAAIYSTPAYQALLTQVSAQNGAAAAALQVADPERAFAADVCANGGNGCAGDVRLYDWQAKGYGIVQPVLFTARDGATISGHVWATRSGPAQRPGIVITNGSVQADEQLYWFAAQVLAKAGYVVLTSDPQGQGQSDTPGEGVDAGEGVPAQSDGRPFYDGTTDALDFFLSTPSKPYEPETSCSTGTSHAAKQDRRVRAGLDAAYDPLWRLVDPTRIGLAGHSYGAAGVSYVGQRDPRVKAIVAWDNLGVPTAGSGGATGAASCPGHPDQRVPAAITKPALGLSADYYLPPEPNTSDPDPLAKSTESRAYSAAGVDSGELIIRGGTHFDFDWIPNQAFGATLRGADLITWYTTAWFDKYVKGDPSADARLLTDRWRHDADEGAVDPDHDPNDLSRYYRSRLDVGLAGGGRFVCEDLRAGCPGLSDDDGVPGHYDFLSVDTSPDGAATAAVPTTSGLASTAAARLCTSRRTVVLHVPRRRGLRTTAVTAYLDGHRLRRARGRAVAVRLLGLPRGTARVTLRVTARRRGRTVTYRLHRTFHTCARKAATP